jgi:hypothetical protein
VSATELSVSVTVSGPLPPASLAVRKLLPPPASIRSVPLLSPFRLPVLPTAEET